MERLTRKWWFYFILLALQFLVPPIATKNFNITKWGEIIQISLSKSLTNSLNKYNIYFQVIAIVMLVCLFLFKNRFKRIFNSYVFFTYILFTIGQNIAITEAYGVSAVTINLVMFPFVAYFWLLESINKENDYAFSNLHWKYSWMIILAVFAFWCPINPTNGHLDFSPKYFLFNGSSLAFCLMTPVYLTIMTLNFPIINILTYRVTAIIGIILGIYNMSNFFNPWTMWLGVLHIPLLSISLFTFILSFKLGKMNKE